MRSSQTTPAGDKIEVTLTRFNAPTQKLELEKDATVEDALEVAGVTMQSSESIWCDGEAASLSSILDNGDILSITGKKEGGFIS